MARNTYFAFHYDDIWRVNHVRHHHLCRGGYKIAGYFDASLWEESQRKGDAAIKRMIDNALSGTSVTAVLIGADTSTRTYVNYEIQQSIARGNGLIGIYINNCQDQFNRTSSRGRNPLDSHLVKIAGPLTPYTQQSYSTTASLHYKTYDWIWDNGFTNFENWVDEAVRLAGMS